MIFTMKSFIYKRLFFSAMVNSCRLWPFAADFEVFRFYIYGE